MYAIAGGKDDNVTAATFLPSWWLDPEAGDSEEVDMEAKRAKIAKMFEQFGGVG